jgi:hypothetical protein
MWEKTLWFWVAVYFGDSLLAANMLNVNDAIV